MTDLDWQIVIAKTLQYAGWSILALVLLVSLLLATGVRP